MLNLVLFGPPGAGKGTQSSKLVDTFNLVHLSTGDIFRFNIKNETELGKLAKSYIDKGELVPDEVTINMLKSELNNHPNAKGFIFDGFPRTVPQAQALDSLLAEKQTHIALMLSLDVPEDELTRRLLERGKSSGRSDDNDEAIIRNRIRVYNEQTAVAANFYKKQNKYKRINGVGAIATIFDLLSAEIKKCLPTTA
ncbi:MAG: adenylate kinase [Bacteroidia bacterium]|nr:adenylate kinase [Bacteroidia bacterium]